MIVVDLRSHTNTLYRLLSDFPTLLFGFGPPLDPSAERLPSVNFLALLDFLPLGFLSSPLSTDILFILSPFFLFDDPFWLLFPFIYVNDWMCIPLDIFI